MCRDAIISSVARAHLLRNMAFDQRHGVVKGRASCHLGHRVPCRAWWNWQLREGSGAASMAAASEQGRALRVLRAPGRMRSGLRGTTRVYPGQDEGLEQGCPQLRCIRNLCFI